MNQNFPLWTMLPGENGKVVAEWWWESLSNALMPG